MSEKQGQCDFMTQTNAVILSSEFSPIERIALTANGNLQRILSAYFNDTVTVNILKNDKVWVGSCLTLDRLVHITCGSKHCVTATSNVEISDSQYHKLVLEDGIGIGQLFNHLNLLPEFKLLKVSRGSQDFSRVYALTVPGIVCIITEVFPSNLFQ